MPDMTEEEAYQHATRIARVLMDDYDPPQATIDAVRRLLPSAPTPGHPFAAEVAEMVAIGRSTDSYAQQKAKLREIGVRVNERGGFDALQSAAMELRHQFPSGEKRDGDDEPKWHPEQLDYAWDGIGLWRA